MSRLPDHWAERLLAAAHAQLGQSAEARLAIGLRTNIPVDRTIRRTTNCAISSTHPMASARRGCRDVEQCQRRQASRSRLLADLNSTVWTVIVVNLGGISNEENLSHERPSHLSSSSTLAATMELHLGLRAATWRSSTWRSIANCADPISWHCASMTRSLKATQSTAPRCGAGKGSAGSVRYEFTSRRASRSTLFARQRSQAGAGSVSGSRRPDRSLTTRRYAPGGSMSC
jgi:hypothetical protein